MKINRLLRELLDIEQVAYCFNNQTILPLIFINCDGVIANHMCNAIQSFRNAQQKIRYTIFINMSLNRVNQQGASARDMSLSIGQSAGYINNIENGINYPSMTVFFYICDYLGITPKEFFDTDTINPTKANELLDAAKGLSSDQLDNLIAIARGLKK